MIYYCDKLTYLDEMPIFENEKRVTMAFFRVERRLKKTKGILS